MVDQDERKELARTFSDRTRRAYLSGERDVLIPHKFTKDGDVIDERNFNPAKDVSCLSLMELRFLKAWRDEKWDANKAAESLGLNDRQRIRIIRKVSYFKFEDAKVKALASIPSPDWIAAKDVENVYGAQEINESQHKSLDRLAKITGAFKPTSEVNIQQNIFNLPKMSAETEKALRDLADKEASLMIEAERVA